MKEAIVLPSLDKPKGKKKRRELMGGEIEVKGERKTEWTGYICYTCILVLRYSGYVDRNVLAN